MAASITINALSRISWMDELKESNGQKYLHFSIYNEDKPNKKPTDVPFINVTAFNAQAELIYKYFTKGSRIFLNLGVAVSKQEGQQERTSFPVRNVVFVDSREEMQKLFTETGKTIPEAKQAHQQQAAPAYQAPVHQQQAAPAYQAPAQQQAAPAPAYQAPVHQQQAAPAYQAPAQQQAAPSLDDGWDDDIPFA